MYYMFSLPASLIVRISEVFVPLPSLVTFYILSLSLIWPSSFSLLPLWCLLLCLAFLFSKFEVFLRLWQLRLKWCLLRHKDSKNCDHFLRWCLPLVFSLVVSMKAAVFLERPVLWGCLTFQVLQKEFFHIAVLFFLAGFQFQSSSE